MERNFRSTNHFNVAVNALSGNILPLTDKQINPSFTLILWVIFVWVVKIIYVLSIVLGGFYFANLPVIDALKRSGPTFAVWCEFMIPSIYLNLHRIDLQNLISKYNDILLNSDEMSRLVQDTIRPYKKGLQLYIAASLIAIFAWAAKPGLAIFTNDQFTYADYSAPAYLPGEPFGTKAFLGGILLQMVGCSFITFGKISIDIYISQFIAVLAAQYKYVRAQMAKALLPEHHQQDDLSVISALQNCVRHHCTSHFIETSALCFYSGIPFPIVTSGYFGGLLDSNTWQERYGHSYWLNMKIGQRLSELVALQIGTTYISGIFKLCFLAFGVITFGGANFEKCMYLIYAFGSVLHIFLICTCVQELSDVSTSVTEDAFHENWHGRSSSVKQLFYTIEMSNQMECRLSAYRIVDLVVPTMAVILSKSYSVCLLLLEVN